MNTDWQTTLDRLRTAVQALIRGDGELYKAMWSRDPSVSMMGAYGGVAHGWAQIEKRIESSAARYAGWEPVYEEELITSVSGHDFAYIVLRERVSDRAGSGEAPRSRRVTVLFHREDDAWRIVHHHSDPLNDLQS